MASCASGSSRGYDELVDYHVHVVKEDRLYRKLATKGQDCHVESGYVHPHEAIIQGKRALNKLHFMLGMHEYLQVRRKEHSFANFLLGFRRSKNTRHCRRNATQSNHTRYGGTCRKNSFQQA